MVKRCEFWPIGRDQFPIAYSRSCLVNSPTRRVGESFLDYEYLRELEAKIGAAQKVLLGIYEDPIYAKTPENPFLDQTETF